MMWDNNSWFTHFMEWLEDEACQGVAMIACMLIGFMTVVFLITFVGIIVKALEYLL